MLIAALSTIAKTWKQPKKDTHTHTHTQTHTLVFSHKKWGNPDTGTTWMKLEDITPSEIS